MVFWIAVILLNGVKRQGKYILKNPYNKKAREYDHQEKVKSQNQFLVLRGRDARTHTNEDY